MNCSLGTAAGVALFAIAALAQEQQATTDFDKIIGIAIASIETRFATSYEITARDRTLDLLITPTAPRYRPGARQRAMLGSAAARYVRRALASAGIHGLPRPAPRHHLRSEKESGVTRLILCHQASVGSDPEARLVRGLPEDCATVLRVIGALGD
jgi:hypothetical protein